MAKVRVTKTVETVKGPGGKILTDEQVESWSDFAQKNQNLNFDQKWDAFSKMNPKFGASKDNLRMALQKHSDWLTNSESERLQRSMGQAYRSGPMGEQQRLQTGDVFLPLYENGKLVGRYGESGELLDKYKKPSQASSGVLAYRQIPSVSDVDLKSYYLNRGTGIADVITNEGKNIKLNVNDLLQHPEWKTFVSETDAEYLRNEKSPKEMMINQGPSIFRK
jgi:hypothetical protein